MGYAAAMWFERGERVSSDTMQKITKQVSVNLLDNLKSIGKKRPSKQSLQQQIEQTLEESPLSDNPEQITNLAGESNGKTPPQN
jgi:hypothetical protein